MQHIVAISGGKDSVAMALLLKETQPHIDFQYICNVTGNELPEMALHWRKLEQLLGAKIKNVSHGSNLVDLCDTLEMLPSWRARWCTRILKIEPTIEYLEGIKDDATLYVGIRADEDTREGMYGLDIPCKFPLREHSMDIRAVLKFLDDRDVKIPARTDCALCPYQRLGEWRKLFFDYPEFYWQGAALELRHGHTFRSPGRDTWPASLEALAAEFLKGRKIRGEDNKKSERCAVCNK